MTPAGLSLDTGALIAIERGDRRPAILLDEARRHDIPVHIVAGVLAQAWRGGPRQARLAHLLNGHQITIRALDEPMARAIGVLCGATGQADVVDVHVVLDARLHGHSVVTTDPDDLRRVDPSVHLIAL